MTPISALASMPMTEPAARPAAPPAAERDLWDRMWGKDGFSFGALLDIVNPLHHIPVVSTIYRAISGDTIGPAPRMMGGAMFGGVVGLIVSAADSAVQAVTGQDTGEHIMAMMPEPDPPSQWAVDNERRALRPLMAGLMNQGPAAATVLAGDVPRAADAPIPVSESDGARRAAPIMAETANPPPAVAPRGARMGAGGRQVPLTVKGHGGATPATLPTPQTLAADPALLREMRENRTATAKNSGRMDTAIRGHGVVSRGPAQPPMTGRATVLGVEPANGMDGARNTTSAIPEVTPEFLMKMQQALEKYQAIRTAPSPSVDFSH